MIRPVRDLVMSDIHLGHKQTTTFEIISHIATTLNDYAPRPDVDILYLAGDVFHQLLNFPCADVDEIQLWISRLIDWCSRNNIKLRVLEGTPSHDWGQSKIFETCAKLMQSPVDLKYIDTLHIEYMEDLDIHVLYIPDEYRSDPRVTYSEVLALMKSLGITHVDRTIMHGQFRYQIPQAPERIPRHYEEDYLSITRHFISIGHVHSFSVYDRIIAQGSVDRLAHGEEEPKGIVECVIKPDGNDEYYFIENRHAKPYVTVAVKATTFERGIEEVKRKTKRLPPLSRVRIKAAKDHPLLLAFEETKKHFLDFVVTKTHDKDDNGTQLLQEGIEISREYTPITITQNNIESLLLDVIQPKYEWTAREMAVFHSLF